MALSGAGPEPDKTTKGRHMTGRRTRLVVAGSLALAGYGTVAGLRLAGEARLAAALAPWHAQGLAGGTVSLDPWSGRARIAGLRFGLGDGVLEIGAVTFPTPIALVTPALAAQDVVLESLNFSSPSITARMPKVELSGVNLDKSALTRLLSDAGPAAERLAKVEATAISIPELTLEQTLGDQTARYVYRDTRLSGIANGRIAATQTATGSFEMKDPRTGTMQGSFGKATGTDIDLGFMLRLYTETAPAGDNPMQVVYGGFSVETMHLIGQDGVDIGVGRIEGRDFRARLMQRSWTQLTSSLQSNADLTKLPPEERARAVSDLVDLLTAMQVGLLEGRDITIKAPSGKGDGSASIARIAFSSTPDRRNDLRLEGFTVAGKEGRAQFGTFALTGWSLQPLVEGLKSTLGRPDFDLDELDPRVFVPEFGSFSLKDVDFDVPDKKSKAQDASAPNIRFGLRSFQLDTANPVHGIPTALRLALDRFTMALPADSKDEGLKDLIAMGYRAVDLSMSLDGAWNEGDNEFVLKDASVSGANMGSATLKGTLGNVTRDVFSSDSTIAQFAVLASTLKSVGLAVENKGLADKLVEREAKRQKKTPDALRRELGSAAMLVIPAALGGTPSAKAVALAVAKFIAKPGRLTVNAKARNPEGIGFSDYVSAGAPQALLQQVEVSASAE
jgi:hypothetical protein